LGSLARRKRTTCHCTDARHRQNDGPQVIELTADGTDYELEKNWKTGKGLEKVSAPSLRDVSYGFRLARTYP
jgi:hypothetical protein